MSAIWGLFEETLAKTSSTINSVSGRGMRTLASTENSSDQNSCRPVRCWRGTRSPRLPRRVRKEVSTPGGIDSHSWGTDSHTGRHIDADRHANTTAVHWRLP